MTNRENFLKIYTVCLKNAVEQYPHEYAYGVDRVPEVAEKVVESLSKGHALLNGRAMHDTCRELGIKFTTKAIKHFLNEEVKL